MSNEDKLEQTLLELISVPPDQFPSMLKFGMSPLGKKLYTQLKLLSTTVRTSLDADEIDKREQEAIEEGTRWLKGLSSRLKRNLESQMKGKLK